MICISSTLSLETSKRSQSSTRLSLGFKRRPKGFGGHFPSVSFVELATQSRRCDRKAVDQRTWAFADVSFEAVPASADISAAVAATKCSAEQPFRACLTSFAIDKNEDRSPVSNLSFCEGREGTQPE
jgi:hypothetical protein